MTKENNGRSLALSHLATLKIMFTYVYPSISDCFDFVEDQSICRSLHLSANFACNFFMCSRANVHIWHAYSIGQVDTNVDHIVTLTL